MIGQYLNEERWHFLSSLESMIEDIREHLVSAKSDYNRFDEWDNYRDDYYIEYVTKIAQAKSALMKVLEVLDE